MKTALLRLFIFILFCGCLIANEPTWKLANGEGERIAPDILQVTGDGTGTAVWQSEPVAFVPGHFYRFSVSHRGIDTNGDCLPCGIEGFSRDYSTQANQWQDESFIFRAVHNTRSAPLRVGHWESKGTFQFRNAKIEPIDTIPREFELPFGQLWLDEGEMIRNGKYQFRSSFGDKGINTHHSFFDAHNMIFNSNRWCFSGNSQLLYHFNLFCLKNVLIPMNDGKLVINVCYHTHGEGVIESQCISDAWNDSMEWTELAKINKTGTLEITLPENFFPINGITLRIRGTNDCYFQVDRIDFEAALPKTFKETDLHALNLRGETLFATIDQDKPSYKHCFVLTQNNELKIVETKGDDDEGDDFPKTVKIIPLEKSRSPGERVQTFELDEPHLVAFLNYPALLPLYQKLKSFEQLDKRFGISGRVRRTYSFMTQTHPLERSDYGYSAVGECWWCEADWKVSRDRQPPDKTETSKPIAINAAKNDVEGFQFVVRADTPITGLTGSVTELKSPNGTVIPAENVELLYVYYHFVHSRTDETGLIGDVGDALPPLNHPIDIAAGRNQPIWVNVKVPSDAAAGNYQGTFRLTSADGKFDVTIPYTLHVWNFALPVENHFETAYGYNPNLVALYHNVKNEADRRRVHEMYLQCLSDHRVSTYQPAPYDEFNVQWLPNENPPRCEIDFSRYDVEMDRVMKKFHFTNFTVPGHGLGGGTFHARTEPSLAGFTADTPQYKAMLADYYAKLQAHLIEKEWIDKAYIYWFDEPGKHDYEFVAGGTAKIEQHAPKIQRFITLMLDNDGFMKTLDEKNTSINIWCPVSNSFREDLAKQRMARGERFWWYVCTGPKAPYCTLFIDHPATELRVWHWQAWQRNIAGGLIWESTYWNSDTAFPNSFQNPYEDPMGYTSGYSTPIGMKRHWGNGDGRFMYPPLSAAVPGRNDGLPIFDKPVSSIRWEMIREGIEDYEMLYMLRELLQQKGDRLSGADRKSAMELLSVPESITKSMTEFTIDPRPIFQRRTAIAEMIEKLTEK